MTNPTFRPATADLREQVNAAIDAAFDQGFRQGSEAMLDNIIRAVSSQGVVTATLKEIAPPREEFDIFDRQRERRRRITDLLCTILARHPGGLTVKEAERAIRDADKRIALKNVGIELANNEDKLFRRERGRWFLIEGAGPEPRRPDPMGH